MYNQTEWQDRVTEFENRYRETQNPDGTFTHTPVDGEIIQVGTPQNQTNFNNIENGIQDTTLARQFLAWQFLHEQRLNGHVLEETHTVTLANSDRRPFNTTLDTPATVALENTRNSMDYTVAAEVTAHSGPVGEIIITDKALNGFKVSYTGSGKSATLKITVQGGLN